MAFVPSIEEWNRLPNLGSNSPLGGGIHRQPVEATALPVDGAESSMGSAGVDRLLCQSTRLCNDFRAVNQ